MNVAKIFLVLSLLAVSIVSSRKTVRVLEKSVSRPSYNCPQKNKQLDVVFKNDYHTNRYYRCISGTAYEFQCPEEALYDPTRRRCQRSTSENRWFLYNTNSLVHTDKCHSGVRFAPVGKISPRYLLCIGDGLAKEKLCPRAYSNGKSVQLIWMGDHCESLMLDDEVACEKCPQFKEYDVEPIERQHEDRRFSYVRNSPKQLKCESVVMTGSSKAIQTDCFYHTNQSNKNDSDCLCKHNSNYGTETVDCITATTACSSTTLPTRTQKTTEKCTTSSSPATTETTTTTEALSTTMRKPLTRCYCVEVGSSEETSDQMADMDDSSRENEYLEVDSSENTSDQLPNQDDSSREKRFVPRTATNAPVSNNPTNRTIGSRYRLKHLPISYFKINYS